MPNAIINYALLKYARKKARLSLHDAADGILPMEKLRQAEELDQPITFDEFRLLSERYHKPITFFYLRELPSLKTRYGWWKDRTKIKILRWIIRLFHMTDRLDELEE